MAQSLSLSLNGYGKIERDEVEITINRLEDISKILEIDLLQILGFDEKQIFNMMHNQNAIGVMQNDDGYKNFIAHLQDENKELRSQNNRLLALLEKK